MQWVFNFEEGNREDFQLLGGKGAGLAEMTKHNLPVPPGFIISTRACNYYLAEHRFPDDFWEQVNKAVKDISIKTGNKFGDYEKPLIVSVRSGAPKSMPGMLETILNIGLTTDFVKQKSKLDSNAAFFYKSYIRLIRMFGKIVRSGFKEKGTPNRNPTFEDVKTTLDAFYNTFHSEFPQDPLDQLRQAIQAVFESWLAPKAVEYRALYQIPEDMGTAVVVQMMVFGNKDENSGTGVAFTRDPGNGENKIYGEYLLNAQGEDLVSGECTPQRLNNLSKSMPEIFTQLQQIGKQLESIYKDAQDIEFTIESRKLWILQTRSAKRTPLAAIKIAVDMVKENLINKETAILRIESNSFSQLLSPRFQDANPEEAIAQGIASSPGSVSGVIAFTRDKVTEFAESGKCVIFVRENTSPDDVAFMAKVDGVLTQHGGATSHAAVVARGLGKPCVVGCEALKVDEINYKAQIESKNLNKAISYPLTETPAWFLPGKKSFNVLNQQKTPIYLSYSSGLMNSIK